MSSNRTSEKKAAMMFMTSSPISSNDLEKFKTDGCTITLDNNGRITFFRNKKRDKSFGGKHTAVMPPRPGNPRGSCNRRQRNNTTTSRISTAIHKMKIKYEPPTGDQLATSDFSQQFFTVMRDVIGFLQVEAPRHEKLLTAAYQECIALLTVTSNSKLSPSLVVSYLDVHLGSLVDSDTATQEAMTLEQFWKCFLFGAKQNQTHALVQEILESYITKKPDNYWTKEVSCVELFKGISEFVGNLAFRAQGKLSK